MVGVDLDVHEITNYRELTWMQPLGICQWALSSAPYHPIMQDITRRIVNNTEYVRTRREQDPKYSLEVLSWTGPVTFTNAVTT